MEVKFNWTIGVGDILTVLSALVVAASILFRGGATLAKLQDAVKHALAEISELKQDVKQMSKVLTELAVQKEQITMLTKWYDELRRGGGWVTGPKGIDREYP